MQLEKLGEFIIPIVMLILYFVLNAKKKKEPPKKHVEEPHRQSPQKKSPLPRQAPLHIPSRIATAEPALPPPRKRRSTPSYASRLVKGKSLREAFLLKEILNRPYE